MNLLPARNWALCALAFGLVSTAASADDTAEAPQKYLLQYKFAVGEILRYDVRHATDVRTTIDGTTEKSETRSDSVKAWKVTDVLPSGEMEFMHVVEWVRMTNDSGNGAGRQYDSRKDAQPPRGFEQAARAVGVPLSLVRIAPDGEVVLRQEKHPQPKPSEDLPITLLLPKEPIAVGAKWSRSYEVPAKRKNGTTMQIQTRRVATLRSVTSGVATIDFEYQILTPVEPYVRAALVERLAQGTVRFDVERGRILSQEQNVDKRVLGFASEASSMHFVSRLSERLLDSPDERGKIQQTSANIAP
ncbi:MAG: hypothetical protein DCC67_03130 [Planctomycetota bacterium]|nr:MAG: hypothetical protein DCC67_03130 [Planctomycetota bacterium]